MDPELKSYLAGMESRIGEGMGTLRARLDSMEEHIGTIEQGIGTLEGRIMERVDGRIDAVEERLKDFVSHAVRDLETKLIDVFWKWGRTSDLRTRQSVTDVGLLNERVLAVEDPISALERSK